MPPARAFVRAGGADPPGNSEPSAFMRHGCAKPMSGCSEDRLTIRGGVGRGRRMRLSVATARRNRMDQTCGTRAAGKRT